MYIHVPIFMKICEQIICWSKRLNRLKNLTFHQSIQPFRQKNDFFTNFNEDWQIYTLYITDYGYCVKNGFSPPEGTKYYPLHYEISTFMGTMIKMGLIPHS